MFRELKWNEVENLKRMVVIGTWLLLQVCTRGTGS